MDWSRVWCEAVGITSRGMLYRYKFRMIWGRYDFVKTFGVGLYIGIRRVFIYLSRVQILCDSTQLRSQYP
jgi:hypothetical protein